MCLPKLHVLCSAFVSFGLVASAGASPPRAPARIWRNSIGMPFVRIPAGSFFMGSSESNEALAKFYPLMEQRRLVDLDDEAPVHAVRISHASRSKFMRAGLVGVVLRSLALVAAAEHRLH